MVSNIKVTENNVVIELPKCNNRKEAGDAVVRNRICSLMSSFKEPLQNAISARMEHCIKGLFDNLSRINYNNGELIEYTREDGTPASFIIPSYNKMKECFDLLEDHRWTDIWNDPYMVDQLCKAILCHPFQRDEEMVNSWNDLVSLLMTHHLIK